MSESLYERASRLRKEVQAERSKERCVKWYRENKEKFYANRRADKEANPEKWKNRNKTAHKKHHDAHPEIRNEATTRRNRTVKGQTPQWADMSGIRKIYSEAREFRDFGIDVTVDHIVPLRGKLACGLHCEANMTIKLASWNFSKGSSFDPETFDNLHPIGGAL